MAAVDAIIGNTTDWELVSVGNLVGLPLVVVPTGAIPLPSTPDSPRKISTTAAIIGKPNGDSVVRLRLKFCSSLFDFKPIYVYCVPPMQKLAACACKWCPHVLSTCIVHGRGLNFRMLPPLGVILLIV